MGKKDENINQNELDNLLKKSFLEEDNASMGDEYAEFILSQEYDVKINPEKEKNFLRKFTGKAGSGLFYTLGSLITAIIIGLTIYFSVNNSEESENETSKVVPVLEEIISNDSNDVLQKGYMDFGYEQISEVEKKNLKEITPELDSELKTLIVSIDTIPQVVNEKKAAIIEKGNHSDTLLLNMQVIARYKKIKKMMLERLIDNDKKLYVSIFPGRVNYMREEIDLTEFYVRNCPVTNLEYKVFLIDLLFQGRNSEYVAAKVRPEIWKSYDMQGMAADYFTKMEYNDFPVVNISEEGAQIFCQWIEKEAKQYANRTKRRLKDFKIRLPYDVEWMQMAITGHANIPDYNGYHTIFDIDEGYIDKAMERRVNGLKRNFKKKKPENKFYSTNRYGMAENEVINIFRKAYDLHDPLPHDTIYPKRMKDFGKFGHVSEMILEKQSDGIIIYGTCWKDKEQFMEMLDGFKKSAGSPFIGIRIVKEYDDAPVYKNPFF